MDNDKIANIEIMLAHQEQQITELNDVITEQWTQIELLNRRLNKVLSKIDDQAPAEKVASERPPHY